MFRSSEKPFEGKAVTSVYIWGQQGGFDALLQAGVCIGSSNFCLFCTLVPEMRRVNSQVVIGRGSCGLDLRGKVSVALSKSHCLSDTQLCLQTGARWGRGSGGTVWKAQDLLWSQEGFFFHNTKWSMKCKGAFYERSRTRGPRTETWKQAWVSVLFSPTWCFHNFELDTPESTDVTFKF